ncbi:MAG: BrnA antitoxin family protein [Limnohabitans sp.]
MTGSKTTSMTLDELRAAAALGQSKTQHTRAQTTAPYVWDGQNQDDRPLTREEMQAGIATYRRQRGRPTGSDKESTTIRFDRDVLAAFRAGGAGWQTRMNAALRDWLKRHTAA